MYLLVTNIPAFFRTPELRNFFSEIIEQNVFHCFHFRHRPHKNFEEHFVKENPICVDAVSGNVAADGVESRPICEQCGKVIHEESTEKDLNGQTSTSHRPPSTGKPIDQEGIHAVSTESQEIEDIIELTRPNELCACHEKDKPKKPLSSQPQDNHWISSGLSGLTSLIKEKKSKAIKDYPKGVQDGKAFQRSKPTTDVTDGHEVRNTKYEGKSSEGSAVGNVDLKQVSTSSDATCCILDIKDDSIQRFLSLYHKKYWIDKDGNALPQKCIILNLGISDLDVNKTKEKIDKDYRTRGEITHLDVDLANVKNMIEFCPPSVMPQGNIGTPTHFFKDLIRACKLPGIVIKKLGLEFPRSRGKKRFGQVPFDYGTEVYSGNTENQDGNIAFTARGHLIPSSINPPAVRKAIKKRKLKKSTPQLELENEAEDGAEVEEWERYEAFHNDVTSQDRTKERVYEKEIELVWEKGGPGLVFYTDAQYWREQEGDFDEQTTDEWDVDMSIYYEKGAGDYDAHNSVDMRESDALRSGALTQSAFKVPMKRSGKGNREDHGKRKKRGPAAPPKIGNFEAHTRGFGRKLMESHGWKDGLGLGRQSDGLAYALGNDGQHPQDKKGFGYHGEKFQGWGEASTSESRHRHCASAEDDCDSRIRISTVFDSPRDEDPPVSYMRTSEPTRLSHRPRNIVFSKSSESEG